MKTRFTTLRAVVMFAALAFAFGTMLVLNVNTGSVSIAPDEIFRLILRGGSDGSMAGNVLWKIRLPRLLAAAVLGGALSVSGFLLQTFFRNPIAGPYVLGISSGAKLFVGMTMVFVLRYVTGVPFWAIMAAAFLGSMVVTGFVLVLARRIRSMSSLLVIGIMIGSICTAITDFFITFADEANVANLHTWSMGSFSAISWQNLNVVTAVVLVALSAAFMLSKPISAYQLGENYARSMGVNVKAFRVALIGLSSVLSACVTALSGPISFVGVAVPHMTKLLFGTARPALIIPGSFLLGGVFCMGCDLIARTAFSPSELAISTVTAVFGAPVVIALMISRQRRKENG
ncbi:MAG: iron ABC transporter permease [Clostridia bacterium]|nr:iron ABC transporter permease [Clostridia bacterium]MBO4883743.1 iron ABC transporter permease [Clostridia bacterium]